MIPMSTIIEILQNITHDEDIIIIFLNLTEKK